MLIKSADIDGDGGVEAIIMLEVGFLNDKGAEGRCFRWQSSQ